mgnify:CR=1 FL=1
MVLPIFTCSSWNTAGWIIMIITMHQNLNSKLTVGLKSKYKSNHGTWTANYGYTLLYPTSRVPVTLSSFLLLLKWCWIRCCHWICPTMSTFPMLHSIFHLPLKSLKAIYFVDDGKPKLRGMFLILDFLPSSPILSFPLSLLHLWQGIGGDISLKRLGEAKLVIIGLFNHF